MKIDENTIKETTRCLSDFDCLKNANHPCLIKKVDFCISGKVHYIDCSEKFCNYQMHFGGSSICNCPTRKEIYNRYRK